MNLYVVISDRSGMDSWVTMVVAPTRGAARYTAWRAYGYDEELNELRYGVRLLEKDTARTERGVLELPASDPLWKLSAEKCGIWKEDE